MDGMRSFLQEFNEAFARSDRSFILSHLDKDIIWNLVGDKLLAGLDAVGQALKEMECIETVDMTISHMILDGKTAAVNGRMKIKEASGKLKAFGFCDVYEFRETEDYTIKEMTSYVVAVKENQLS